MLVFLKYINLGCCFFSILLVAWTFIEKQQTQGDSTNVEQDLKRKKIGAIRRVVLWVTVALSFINYSMALTSNPLASIGKFWFVTTDTYDLLHYYINPKYYREIGYYELYPALVAVNEYGKRPWLNERERDSATIRLQSPYDFTFVKYKDYVNDQISLRRTRALFSDQRWNEFYLDVHELCANKDPRSFRHLEKLLTDHGYNGSPFSLGTASFLASIVPASKVKWLCLFDVGLMLVAFFLTVKAFGLETLQFLLLFLFNSFSSRWPTLGWSFERWDCVAAMLISTCLLKQSRFLYGGGFAGIAAALRTFPIIWFLGPCAGALKALVKPCKSIKSYAFFFIGAATTILILFSITAYKFGITPFYDYADRMSVYRATENMATMQQGLKVALAFDGNIHRRSIGQDGQKRINEQALWVVPLSIFLTVLFVYFLRDKPPFEQYAFSAVPFFLLITGSYYLYVTKATLILVHASGVKKFRNALGLGLIFLTDGATFLVEQVFPGARWFHMGLMGYCLMIYTVIMLVLLGWECVTDNSD